jgi:UrcA family protein
MTLKIMIAASAAALATLSPTVAQAQEPIGFEQRTTTVRYGDLNLASAEGRKQFDRRMEAAIRNVCGDPATRDLRGNAAALRCAATVKRNVAPAIDVAMASARPKAARA